jgi:hypothetical protein
MATAELLIPEATEIASLATSWEVTRSERGKLLFSDPAPRENFEGSDARPALQPRDHSAAAPFVTRAPLVRITSHADSASRRIQVLQQLEGVVLECGAEDFTAELRNLTEKKTAPEFAEFSYAEVSQPDRPLLQRGAVFYWVVGYDTNPTGQITRISEIRFRRSPKWSSRKLRIAAERAAQRLRGMNENADQR